jgi:hypothetical protein
MESTSASHNMLRTSLALGRPTRRSNNCGRTHQGARLATEMLPRDLGVHTALGDEKPWSEVDLEALNDISRIIGLDRLRYLERGGLLVISVWTDDAQGRPIGEPAGHSSGLSMSPSKSASSFA